MLFLPVARYFRCRFRRTCPFLLLFLSIFVGQPVAAVDSPPITQKTRVLRFVTYAAERPSEELRKIEPFQRHVEAVLNAKGFNLRIELRIFSTYTEAQEALYSGNFDFARIGPANYVLARERKAPVRLLVMESHQGDTFFEGAIFTRSDSGVTSMADIKGKRFAFGEQTSTTGAYLAQAALVQAGIKASDLGGFEYLGRHDKVALAVAAGTFDVGATNERTIEKYAGRGLKKLKTFVTPTQAWVVNERLDGRLADAMRTALLHVDQNALKYIDRDGFLPGRESYFDELRKAMRLSRQFGG
ncbi:PhnD/SsuA/transferrin family substrate-binding protein [Dechloromonas sp. TW-R-39-2]|nr:PhnD/SsuA/transferrin family substrate-binding protein [Dechloromonas sp. TW-R-39-2]